MPAGNTDGYKTGKNEVSGVESISFGVAGNCSKAVSFGSDKAFKNASNIAIHISILGNASSNSGELYPYVPNTSITKTGFLIWTLPNKSQENYSATRRVAWTAVEYPSS